VRTATAALLGAVLLSGCASKDSSLREPQLTNPPRVAEWIGWDSSQDPPQTATERDYSGAFRIPMSDDWIWQMPDKGRWEISRLELGTPVFDGDHLIVGNSRWPGLFQLDRGSGRVQRWIETAGPVQARPLKLDDGWLVVDVFGNLTRFDLEFEPVWDAPHQLAAAVFRAPVLFEDLIIVGTATDAVVAVSLDEGAWRWSYKRDVPRTSTDLAILGAPTPTLHGDEILTGFADGAVVGLDARSGQLRWSAPIGTGKFPDVQAEILVEGDLLLTAGFGGPVVALDAETHKERWRNDEAGASSSMVLVGGTLYTSDSRGRVQALDSQTGTIEWSWELKDRQFGPPIRAGGWILVGDVAGGLYALDRFEGTLAWRYRPSDGTRLSGIAAEPAVEGRQIVFPTAAGRLISLVADVGVGEDLAEEPRHRRDRTLGW
jgi:outer membrane protein assembly factor BamB